MNIAMVSEHASPLAVLGGADAGGQNVHVAELSSALARAGHSIRVFTRRDNDRDPSRVTMPSGVTVEHLDAGPPTAVPKDELWPFMPTFSRELLARLRRDPADVLHAHFWMSASAALDAVQSLKVPIVQTFHALGSEKARMQGAADTSPTARLAQELRIIASADRIVATSSSEIFELCRLGADPRRLKLIPCGVDFAAFNEQDADSLLPRRETYRIVTLSRLVERKGVADVIAALADVPRAELIVAGGPATLFLDDDADVRRLREHARIHGVVDRVRFVGRVARKSIPSLLRSADVVACAAWYEPFGIVPLEAMAAGRPVVATAVGGQNDTVLDGYTGLLVPPRNPRVLAQAICSLLADAKKRRALGEAGRHRVRDRFSWERVARETYAVYHSVARVALQPKVSSA